MTPRGSTRWERGRRRRGRRAALCASLLLCAVVGGVVPSPAVAEQASEPSAPAAAGGLDAGGLHSCALVGAGGLRCWGYGASGQLGYGSLDSVGDDETPASVGPVSFGPGRSATAISAGDFHTCAILDDGTVRCWGYGGDGRLGYANTSDVSDPGSVGPVDLGGHTARAISAGAGHTCAIRDDGSVVCWGFGGSGRLGYGTSNNVGDRQTPGSAGPVDLGGRTALAISAGHDHTCAILDDGNVRCWGRGVEGALGSGGTDAIGDNETPGSVPVVSLPAGRTAKAISAGGRHTCVVLDDKSVRCWGDGSRGELGAGDNSGNTGDTPATTPDKLNPVDLGSNRGATAISAGDFDSCAVLDDATVRCWGFGGNGALGYASTANVGDDETPGSVGPVDLGPGGSATAISAGQDHTCARLEGQTVRCWGLGANGRLGYCSESNVGDSQTPGSVGPVNLQPGDGGVACAIIPPPPAGSGPGVAPTTTPPGAAHPLLPRRPAARRADPYVSQALRAHALTRCLRKAARRARRHRARAQKACRGRYGRTPGRVARTRARARSSTAVVLSFAAAGSDGPHPPPAHAYLIRQSTRPIHTARDFRHAQTLCHGNCRFSVTALGTTITLTITQLRSHTTYYYAVAARDNVSGRPGPVSATAHIRTR